MAQLQVTDINVPNLLKKLKTNEWLVPQFQRDFVWTNAAVISLVNSIIDARPIGMLTLWEQQDDSALVLEPISIPDMDTTENKTAPRFYTSNASRPGRYYAVLDGRQRSTALAMAFGGLQAQSKLYRHSGTFFLDVAARDENERVKFVSTRDIEKQKVGTLAGAISQGLFPLASDDPDGLMGQWMAYLQHIRNPEYYEGGSLPPKDELERRNAVLSKAFAGILNTKLAVYIVPSEYSLSDICDIFETLNTTGTKVSPVDLIHSGLYNDTLTDIGGPLLLREAIDTLGELDGAVGWSSSKERPELIAQFVAACYVAMDTKAAPRKSSSQREVRITSVKSADLLAVPSAFWRKVFDNSGKFASFIGGFQSTVAGGSFSMRHCPYPASAAIYVALRWFKEFDTSPAVHWDIDQLDRLYRAFFWRNVLLARYDQGFLTQIGSDIRSMKDFLNKTQKDYSADYWRTQANTWLDLNFGPRPTLEDIIRIVSNGNEKGASRRGALLLHYARAISDPVNTSLSISQDSNSMDLHHIYPKDWCKNNAGGSLKSILDIPTAERDWVNSSANLIPMHRKTNNEWRKMSPVTFLEASQATYDTNEAIWARYFVNRPTFEQLMKGDKGVGEFWRMRADAIAVEIFDRTVA